MFTKKTTLHILTISNSEGMEDGLTAQSNVYLSEQECKSAAYAEYTATWKDCLENNRLRVNTVEKTVGEIKKGDLFELDGERITASGDAYRHQKPFEAEQWAIPVESKFESILLEEHLPEKLVVILSCTDDCLNPFLSRDEFTQLLHTDGYVSIQMSDCHIEFACSQQEIEQPWEVPALDPIHTRMRALKRRIEKEKNFIDIAAKAYVGAVNSYSPEELAMGAGANLQQDLGKRVAKLRALESNYTLLINLLGELCEEEEFSSGHKNFRSVVLQNDFVGALYRCREVLGAVGGIGQRSMEDVDERVEEAFCECDDLLRKLQRRKRCPKCGKPLYHSDLSQYQSVCYNCDENFD